MILEDGCVSEKPTTLFDGTQTSCPSYYKQLFTNGLHAAVEEFVSLSKGIAFDRLAGEASMSGDVDARMESLPLAHVRFMATEFLSRALEEITREYLAGTTGDLDGFVTFYITVTVSVVLCAVALQSLPSSINPPWPGCLLWCCRAGVQLDCIVAVLRVHLPQRHPSNG